MHHNLRCRCMAFERLRTNRIRTLGRRFWFRGAPSPRWRHLRLGPCIATLPPILFSICRLLVFCSFCFRHWLVSSGLPSAFMLRWRGSLYFVAVSIAFEASLLHAFHAFPLVFLPLMSASKQPPNKTCHPTAMSGGAWRGCGVVRAHIGGCTFAFASKRSGFSVSSIIGFRKSLLQRIRASCPRTIHIAHRSWFPHSNASEARASAMVSSLCQKRIISSSSRPLRRSSPERMRTRRLIQPLPAGLLGVF